MSTATYFMVEFIINLKNKWLIRRIFQVNKIDLIYKLTWNLLLLINEK